ncbi:ROK family protein [Lacticaseibacillus pabuli]|uniref:ROK family protein n=1 Tax=Lacticaseibacillus pabuli TaxID=3025672 RepID=A0ABY7WRP7_9LACO|nr:ROK family protein [Lacticaseibacillus sp. KACC 23028]WDF82860.1 ROK family protein [Lacticaseibacillus sp. KACC 23028]
MKHYLGFDIGGTSIKYGVVDEKGTIVERGSFETAKDDGMAEPDKSVQKSESQLTAERAANIDGMIKVLDQYKDQYTIAGIGIDAPGIVRSDGYMITGGAIDSFYEFPLGETIAARSGLPTKVENDANAAAIAERWLGNARGVSDYILLALGTGIGGGIVINGKVFRGAHGMAGEIGWSVTHDPDFTQDLEAASLNFSAATVMGLVRRYNASLKQFDASAPEQRDARKIIALAHKDDQIAAPVYRQFLQDIGIMVLNLLGTFDPELVLIGGGISANETFEQDIHAMVEELLGRHESLNRIRHRVLGTVRMAGLRNDAGLLGAVYPLVAHDKEDK